jgi:hypothetical protein
MSPGHYDIQQVKSITADGSGVQIGLANNSTAFLDSDHSAYAWTLGRLRQCKQGGGVLGIRVDPNRKIIDVAGAYRGPVAGVQPYSPGMPDVEIWFGGLDGPMRLATEEPLFSRRYEELVQAKETDQAVWYIMKGGYLLDVHVLSSAEDALVCQRIQQKG